MSDESPTILGENWRIYRSWVKDVVALSSGGFVAFTIALLLAVALGIVGTGVSFYNVESGHDPDQVLGFQIAFSWVAAAIVGAVLGFGVFVIDACVRGLDRLVRRRR